MADQNQPRRDNPPTVEMLYDAPVRGDGFWEVNLWLVIKRGSNPFSDLMVRILYVGLSGLLEENSSPTDNEGRTNLFTLQIPANQTRIQVEIMLGTTPPTRVARQINLGQFATKSKKTADKLKVQAHGNDGKYKVLASVTAQDRTPIKDVLIIAFNPDKENILDKGITDSDGLVMLKIPDFTEPGRHEFRFMAPATAMPVEKLRLYGPPRSPQKRERPLLDDTKMDWNPLNAIRLIISAWKQGGERNQQDQNDL